MHTRRVLVIAIAAGAVGLLGTAGAVAQIIGVPDTVEIGTTPSDHPNGLVAVANGGCATGTVVVGVGGCAPSGMVSIGLGGSGAKGDIVIADSGDAETFECNFLCVPPHVAVTGGGGDAGCTAPNSVGVNLGTGCAAGGVFAFANNGHADGGFTAATQSGTADADVAVAVTGDAGTGSCSGTVAVSVAGDTCTDDGTEVPVLQTVTELLP